MEKQIVSLTENPHTVSLSDRHASLFIDPTSGNIFADEGDGVGRMNGAVFTPNYHPVFSIDSDHHPEYELILNYAGRKFIIGTWDEFEELSRWVTSANALLLEKQSIANPGVPRRPTPVPNVITEVNLSRS